MSPILRHVQIPQGRRYVLGLYGYGSGDNTMEPPTKHPHTLLGDTEIDKNTDANAERLIKQQGGC